MNPPTAQDPPIECENREGIAIITLNRPKQYNALSVAMLDALHAELDRLQDDTSVRVLVIAAHGKAFCAGHDLKEMKASNDAVVVRRLFERCTEMMLKIARLPIPVIAEVGGMATAAGCQLVAQCDLAVASEDAKFAVSGVNLGLFCATPAVPLSRSISRKRAAEMLMTGEFVSLVELAAPAIAVAPALSLDRAKTSRWGSGSSLTAIREKVSDTRASLDT